MNPNITLHPIWTLHADRGGVPEMPPGKYTLVPLVSRHLGPDQDMSGFKTFIKKPHESANSAQVPE